MTLKEVKMIIDTFIENQKSARKKSQAEVYNTAYLTSIFVGCVLGGKRIPLINEVFSENDSQEIQVKDPAKELIEASILEDKMRDFARNANEQRRNK